MVPNGWEIGNFSSLGIKTIDGDRGKNYPKKDEYLEDGYCLFLGADNVSSNGLMLDKKSFLTREKHEQLGNGVVKYDDLLLIMRGNGTGRVCIYDRVISSYENARINSGLIIIRLNPDFLDKNFALQLMRSSFVIKQFESFMFGSAQPQLTVKILKSLKLPRPALPEQRKIAKTLSIWDKAISTTEKLIETSKQQKKALMQQLLTGKKRLRSSPKYGAEMGKMFQGEWEEVKLGDISEITTGNSNREDSSLDAQYTFFDRSEDIRTSSRYLFDSEAVIVAGEGQDFVPKHFEGKFDLHQRTYAIMNFEKSFGKFLYYYIGYYRHYFLAQAVGSTVKSLRLPMFQKMPISLPVIEEQQKIASVLTAADKEITVLETKLAHFKQEKKALMQQLLTGKRRVKVGG
ncbi:restriction endonuclease subunit S [Vibrio crassostreae]|uniref:restriction endonuclease subunit S n=1 Tax=Vibrio crassostreae TaxID=246167 RepID=UPI0011B38794|nr:restriction endonuclease subunit S [Vibrio crassostreae]NOI51557.1 restriction endonuclease subunit S [Vibrio crassostreae]